MDQKIIDKIVKLAHEEQDWKKEEVEVQEDESLQRGSCSFYIASNNVWPLPYRLYYAVVPGDTVISQSDDHAVNKILDTCGSDAPADWWAEIVTRFDQELGSGVVLTDEDEYPEVVDKIRDAKKEFAPPKFSDEASGKTVSFIVLDGEALLIYFVKATRAKDGNVTVTKSEPLAVITESQPH